MLLLIKTAVVADLRLLSRRSFALYWPCVIETVVFDNLNFPFKEYSMHFESNAVLNGCIMSLRIQAILPALRSPRFILNPIPRHLNALLQRFVIIVSSDLRLVKMIYIKLQNCVFWPRHLFLFSTLS